MSIPGQTLPGTKAKGTPSPGLEVTAQDVVYDVTGWRQSINAFLSTVKDAVTGVLRSQIIGDSGNTAEVDAMGQLHVVLDGMPDANNSTTELLEAGETFTGVATDVSPYASIVVMVFSDVASAVNGLEVQYSPDGEDWHAVEAYTVKAGAYKVFTPPAFGHYLRVTYTNGATPQSAFHLHVMLKKTPIKWSSHNVTDPITDEDDGELVKAIITGKQANGVYANVSLTNNGNMKTSLEELESGISVNGNTQLRVTPFDSAGNETMNALSMSKGAYTGVSAVAKFGAAPDFDSTDGEVVVWDGAEDGTAWELMDYVYSTTADIDSISSDNAGDTQNITIQGLDTNYTLVNQTVALNGQTRVPLSTSLVRVFRAYNDSGTTLAGHVFIYKNGALTGGVPDNNADIRAVIHPENNQTEMAIYTVPANTTGFLYCFYGGHAGASRSTNYIFRIYRRDFGKAWRLQSRFSIPDSAAPYEKIFNVPLKFSEKTDIEVTCELSETGVSSATVIAGFDIVLEAN